MKLPKRPRILVTGATGGIGGPLCLHLAETGHDLVILARNESRIAKLVGLVEQRGASACGLSIDLGDPTSFARVWSFVQEGIDGLVIMPPQLEPTVDCLPADQAWQEMFRNSFIGPLALVREALPYLRKRARSKVVIISGISSVQILSHYATSNVLRTAWLAQAKTLAFAFGADGVHFNTLSLGGVMTDEYKMELRDEASAGTMSYEKLVNEQVNNVPLRKYATPEEVAVAVTGLLSNFSDHITGMNILCDGGFTRAY